MDYAGGGAERGDGQWGVKNSGLALSWPDAEGVLVALELCPSFHTESAVLV